MFDWLPLVEQATKHPIELLTGLVVVSNIGWLIAFLIYRRKKRREVWMAQHRDKYLKTLDKALEISSKEETAED